MSYYTFGFEALQNLNQVTELVVSKGWTVGDLWKKLVKYSNQRLKIKKRREPNVGLFDWLISIKSA
jgi:poly(ADP-ribose) glycohydrolase